MNKMGKPSNLLSLTLISLSCFLSSCASLDVNAIGTQNQFSKDSDEERLWKRVTEEEESIAKSGVIYDDANLTAYLNDLALKILPDNVKATGVNVKVIVIKNPEINACMFPNGVMYIHTGLLANVENEAQLVSVLGHEETHFINRHSLKQFRNMINKSAFFATLSMVATSASGLTSVPTDFSSVSMYSYISSVSGYSRKQEMEADKGGFEALLRNNYSLTESVKVIELFEREYKEEKNRPKIPYAFLDHPTNKARIKYYNKLCKLYENETKDINRHSGDRIYERMTKDILLDNAILDIEENRFSSAKRTLERYLQLVPQDPKAYYYLGELFSNRNEKDDQKKAIENYKQSIEVNKDFSLPYRELGLIYYKNRVSDEAKKEFETYLTLNPNAEDKKYILIYLDELKKWEGDKK